MSTNNKQLNNTTDSDNQRTSRARALKLKKWILNINNSSTKTLEMEAKLTQYHSELEQLQETRSGLNRHAVVGIKGN